MYSKYDEMHQALSIAYNRSLEAGDYDKALVNLDGLIEIARLEDRPNDLNRLLEIKDSINAAVHFIRYGSLE